jgi:hypothetical protein
MISKREKAGVVVMTAAALLLAYGYKAYRMAHRPASIAHSPGESQSLRETISRANKARHARDDIVKHSIHETADEMRAKAAANAKAGIHDPVDDLFRGYDVVPVYAAGSCDYGSRTKDIVRVPGDVVTRFDWMAIRASRSIPFCQAIAIKGVSARRFINRGGMDALARRYQELKEHGAF